MRLDVALELSKYLSKETQVMAVQQGFSELVPLYKLMEKRDMFDFVNQMKVGEGAARDSSRKHTASCSAAQLKPQNFELVVFVKFLIE